MRIFPDATLLNHIPDLLRLILESIANPDFGRIDDHPLVESEIVKLAELRRSQGYTLDELVAEFHILREVLHPEIQDASDLWPGPPVGPRAVLALAHDIDWALSVFTRRTSRVYVDAASGDREQRAELLSAYGRAITHELRSRLNNAVLTLDVYRQRRSSDCDDERQRELLDRLATTLEQLDGVAADVFAAVVSESRLTHTPGRRLPFDQVLEDTCEELRLFAEQRDVRIVQGGDHPTFQVDAPRLHVVLVNLLTNAVKYADPEKSERWVRASTARESKPGLWRVKIEDNGVGIDVPLRDLVFRRHLRGTAADDEPGEGLGLTLAHEAASQLGGRLWLESEPGRGTKFSFTLQEPDAALTVASDEG